MVLIIAESTNPNESITHHNISTEFLAKLINNSIVSNEEIQSLSIEIRDEELLWITVNDQSAEHSRKQYKLNLRIGDEYIILYCVIPCNFASDLDPNDERLFPLVLEDDHAVMVDGILMSWINNFNYGRYTTKASLAVDEDGEQIFISKEILFERGLLIRSFTDDLLRFLEDCMVFLDVFDESFN